MDAKDLRTEAALEGRNNDGNTKYAPSGSALQGNRNKPYQDVGANSLAKVDVQNARPCAVIGPDRVLPPPASYDAYLTKGPPVDPWPADPHPYRRPPEYPHKLPDYQHPSRNISPRQTFQENMQRILVPPCYNSTKIKENPNFPVDTNIPLMRNIKINVPAEAKYCDVPYTVNALNNEQKNLRNVDIGASNINSVHSRSAPHGWPPGSANTRPPKPYGAPELYQYPEYQSCAGPRPVIMTRPHRTAHEDPGHLYSDPYQHESNIRFKPYPTVKERLPQARYEYIGNYPSPYHPPPFPTHKYDLQKALPPHQYSGYPQVPLKYLDSRMHDPIMNGYQRPSNQQANFNNVPFRSPVIQPTYGPVSSNIQANKFYPYPSDSSVKMAPNKLLPYDSNNKIYTEYENARTKGFPESFFVNEMSRQHPMKSQLLPSNYSQLSMHTMPTNQYYRKDFPTMKNYEYAPHFRNIDPSINVSVNPLARLPSQFSPSTIAMSPSDSNTSIETAHTQGTAQEDYGYASQSSSSTRSMDFGMSRIPNDLYRRYEYRYGPLKPSSMWSKSDPNPNSSIDSKDKKDIRQFLQNWSEGEEENGESKARENISKLVPNSGNNMKHYPSNDQEQLYVLGLVNVSSDELAKYEHIQKVSKLPENIKGYNNIELLTQFEEVIESTKLNNFNVKPSASRDFHSSLKSSMPLQGMVIPPRPLSPLDVEAKISQSVIHKDVGCNFEIKPCSPKMLNVEIAAPVQTVLGERVIEKVTNPHITNSPIMHIVDENIHNCNVIKRQNNRISLNENPKVTSCKMIKTQCPSNDTIDSVKTNYSLQDFESSSGVCLASLPRLDNDIELSFPEVNQQFINANRMEPHTDFTPLKDLPTLDFEQSDEITKNREIDHKQFLSSTELEKDCSKLSKYRKQKKKVSETKDQVRSEPSPQAMRTDSVIIKNPDNIKSHDERADSPYTTTNNSVEDAQIDPINLTVHSEEPIVTGFDKFENTNDKPNEFAIDFSLNSNEHYSFKRTVKTTENDTQDTLFYDTKEKSADIKSNDHTFTHLINESKFTELQEISPNVSHIIDDPVEVSKSKDNEFNVNVESHFSNKRRYKNVTTTELSVVATIQPVSKDSNDQKGASTDDTKDKNSFEDLSSIETVTASCTVPQAQQKNNIQNEKNVIRDDTDALFKAKKLDYYGTHLNEHSSKHDDADEVIVENKLESGCSLNTKKITDLSTTFDDILVHSGHEKKSEILITKAKKDDQITSSENLNLHEIHKIETDSIKRKQNQAPVSVTKKVRHLNKEMFSPWIQKLILNEGKNNIIMDKKTSLETVFKKTVPVISNIDCLVDNTKYLKTTDKKVLERPESCDDESMFTKNLSNLRKEKSKTDVIIHHMADYKMSEPISEKLQDDHCVSKTKDINTLNKSFSKKKKSNVEELMVDNTISESHSETMQSVPRSDEAHSDLITKQFAEKMKSGPYIEDTVLEYSTNEHTCQKSKTIFRSNAIMIENKTTESILKTSENYPYIPNTNSVFNKIFPEKTQIDNDVSETMFENIANKVVPIPTIDIHSFVDNKIIISENNNNDSHVDETKVEDSGKETIEKLKTEKLKTVPCVNGTSSDFMICESVPVKFETSACLDQKSNINLSNDTVSDELQTEPGDDKKTSLCSDVIVIGNTTSESISKVSEDYLCISNTNSVVSKMCLDVKTQIDNCSNQNMFKNIAKELVPNSAIGMDSYVCKKIYQFSKNDINDSHIAETKVKDEGKKTIEILNTIPCMNSTSEDSKKFDTSSYLCEKINISSSSDIIPDKSPLVTEPGFGKKNVDILEIDPKSEELSSGIKSSDFTKQYKKNFNTPTVDFVSEQLNTNVNKKNGDVSSSESPTGVLKTDLFSNEPLNTQNKSVSKEEETVTRIDKESNDVSNCEPKSNDIRIDGSIGDTFSSKQTISVKIMGSCVDESLQVENTTHSLISETVQNGFNVDSSTDRNITSEKSSKLCIADSSNIKIKIDTITDTKGTDVDKTTVHVEDLKPDSNNFTKCDLLCNDEDKTNSLNITCSTDYSLTNTDNLNFEMNQECKEGAVKIINNCNSNNIEKVIAQQTSFVDSNCGNCTSVELKLLKEKSNLSFEAADEVSNYGISDNVEGLAVAAQPLSSLATLGFKSFVGSKLKHLNKKITTSSEESSSVIALESNDDNLSKKDTCTINNLKQDTIVKNSQKTLEHYIVKENKEQDENLTSDDTLKKTNLFDSFKNIRYVNNKLSIKKRTCLKRSMSDSALHTYIIDSRDTSKQAESEDSPFSRPNKRKRMVDTEVISEPQLLTESYCNIIQHNRRNSISSIHNEQNISFCIFIDNDCIITEECNENDNDDEAEKICFTELTEECLSFVPNDCTDEESTANEIQDEINLENSMPCTSDCEDEGKSIEESWVEDVACVETVVSDDIAEDIIISASTSPRDTDISDNEFNNDDSGVFNVNDYMERVKYIYGDKMCSDDAQLVETLYRTPQMDVNRTLISRESQGSDEYGHGTRYYDTESLEKVLSESINYEETACKLDAIPFNSSSLHPSDIINSKITEDEKQIDDEDDSNNLQFESKHVLNYVCSNECEKQDPCGVNSETTNKTLDNTVLLCESSVDSVFSYSRKKSPNCTSFSSPEVSSTTYEERNSSILLKITNCGGSMISQVHDINSGNNSNRISCKYTETKDYLSSNNNVPSRPLITKGAQKYIPPLKESMHDLKVKLPLPQHSLIKLKELKVSKEEPKPNRKVNSCKVSNVLHKETPKKPKPKFEDVLKSIDEIQFKMHKEKNKKIKKSIPRVVIKKTENGSHYASTSNNDQFNPDLTGRKWQPWVFLEKNHFIDKMTLMKKTRAIFSHRKKTYVLAEKFQKYKSIGNGKFIISQPKLDDSSKGKLKYTIRLKHSY